jgi:hypothetical protein
MAWMANSKRRSKQQATGNHVKRSKGPRGGGGGGGGEIIHTLPQPQLFGNNSKLTINSRCGFSRGTCFEYI